MKVDHVAVATGLRERTRRAVRAELIDEARHLFAAQGFQATTVEQIAAAAGMSKRSFFRYFGSKEDLVLGNVEETGQRIAASLARRQPDESPWTALRRAFDGLVAAAEADPNRTRPLLHMLSVEPALRASHVERRQRWRDLFAPHIAQRLPARPIQRPEYDPRPGAVAGAALACLYAAETAWLQDPTGGLAAALDVAMTGVAPLTGQPFAHD
jgi:AcrR family transcriptional regulator